MKKSVANTLCESRFHLFHMPDRVDAEVLAAALRECLPAGAGILWVLDFSATVHIHYGAFELFATQLRRDHPGVGPVFLAGLNPYCGEIVHFALQAADWDLFAEGEIEFEFASEAPRGNGVDEAPRFEGKEVRILPGDEPRLFLPPCPN